MRITFKNHRKLMEEVLVVNNGVWIRYLRGLEKFLAEMKAKPLPEDPEERADFESKLAWDEDFLAVVVDHSGKVRFFAGWDESVGFDFLGRGIYPKKFERTANTIYLTLYAIVTHAYNLNRRMTLEYEIEPVIPVRGRKAGKDKQAAVIGLADALEDREINRLKRT